MYSRLYKGLPPVLSCEKLDTKQNSPKPGELEGCRDGSSYPFFSESPDLAGVYLWEGGCGVVGTVDKFVKKPQAQCFRELLALGTAQMWELSELAHLLVHTILIFH